MGRIYYSQSHYNHPMGMTLFLLSVFFLLGLLFIGLMLIARSPRARLALLISGLGVVDLGGLAVLFAAFLVSRLDGARPPGVFEFLGALWAPVALLVLVNIGLGLVFWLRRKR